MPCSELVASVLTMRPRRFLFESTEAVLRFERRAIAEIRHAAGYSVHRRGGVDHVDRVSTVAAEAIAALSFRSKDMGAGCTG
jgi:hypothetical protein